jgi:hypothetical protein
VVGLHQKKVCSKSSPFTPWLAQNVVAFPEKVFGTLGLVQGRLSLRG